MRTLLMVLLLAATATAGEAVAIRGAKILSVAGDPIESGTIVVRDGRIEAVGADVEVPWDARVIEGKGMVVTPGLVDPETQGGLDRANERMPVAPFVSVVDSIDPDATWYEDALRQGITTLLVSPGDETVIGGQAAVVHPFGTYVDEMLVVRDAGMKIAIAPRRGVSRMVQMAELRRALDAAVRVRDERKEKKDESAPDPTQAAMLRLLSGELPAIFACERAMDVLAALRLMEEYGLDGRFVLGRECGEAAKALAERKIPVVLRAPLAYWDEDRETGREERKFVPAPFRAAGVPFAVSPGGPGMGDDLLWYQAATLVKHGVPHGEALRAVTLDAAAAIGLADRIGSIEAGKDADLVIWTGDPLSVGSWVSTVLIGGKVVYEREKDEKLAEILGEKGE